MITGRELVINSFKYRSSRAESRSLIDTFTGTGRLDAHAPDTNTSSGKLYPWVSRTGTISGNAAGHTEVLGAEQATGTLTIGVFYIITASEVNYFYVGSAIGDYFKATAATALNANNKVQAITLSSILSLSNLGFSQGRWWFTPAAAAKELSGIVVLANDSVASTDGLFCRVDRTAGKLQVFKRVAGTDTSLLSTAVTYSAGAKACLVYDKTQGGITAFYNNAIVGTFQALTNASIINNTWHGVMSTGAATVDDFNAKSLGYGAELLTDGNLENWASATTLTSWDEFISGTSTINRDSTGQYSGTYCARLDVDAIDSNVFIRSGASLLLTGNLYKITGYIKASAPITSVALNGRGAGLIFILIPSVTTSYAKKTTYYIPVDNQVLELGRYAGGGGASKSIYFDQFSVQQVQ